MLKQLRLRVKKPGDESSLFQSSLLVMFLGPEGAFVGIVPRYTAVRPLMRYTTNTVVAKKYPK